MYQQITCLSNPGVAYDSDTGGYCPTLEGLSGGIKPTSASGLMPDSLYQITSSITAME